MFGTLEYRWTGVEGEICIGGNSFWLTNTLYILSEQELK